MADAKSAWNQKVGQLATQRLFPAVAEYPLRSRIEFRDDSVIIHPDDRIRRAIQDGASAPLALEERRFPTLAADELPDLIPDRRHRPKQVSIWGRNSARKTLDHANDVVVETNRASERAVNASRACDRRARKVGVVNHVFNPCGFTRGPHASGQTDTRRKER